MLFLYLYHVSKGMPMQLQRRKGIKGFLIGVDPGGLGGDTNPYPQTVSTPPPPRTPVP